jgi:aspartyl-tRNA(Asn)/glutamyl-tRNA(Gln) amidotransferase subunit C
MITRDDVKKIAELARLQIPENELEKFTGQMNQILEFVERLNSLDTGGITPTSHAIPITNAFREDKVVESPESTAALEQAPDQEGHLFKVPKVI